MRIPRRLRRAGGHQVGHIAGDRLDDRTIQRLDRRVLRARTIEIFPAGYTMLLSIVQGIALGTLAQQFFSEFNINHLGSSWFLLVAALAVFLAIITVSYMYIWFTLVLRWAPTILDTLIPFCLGVFELSLAYTLGTPQVWGVLVAVFEFAGGFAFFHSAKRATTDMFVDARNFRSIVGLLWLLCAAAFVAGLLSLGESAAAQYLPKGDLCDLTPITLLLVGLTMIYLSERKLQKLYERMRLDRWFRRT